MVEQLDLGGLLYILAFLSRSAFDNNFKKMDRVVVSG